MKTKFDKLKKYEWYIAAAVILAVRFYINTTEIIYRNIPALVTAVDFILIIALTGVYFGSQPKEKKVSSGALLCVVMFSLLYYFDSEFINIADTKVSLSLFLFIICVILTVRSKLAWSVLVLSYIAVAVDADFGLIYSLPLALICAVSLNTSVSDDKNRSKHKKNGSSIRRSSVSGAAVPVLIAFGFVAGVLIRCFYAKAAAVPSTATLKNCGVVLLRISPLLVFSAYAIIKACVRSSSSEEKAVFISALFLPFVSLTAFIFLYPENTLLMQAALFPMTAEIALLLVADERHLGSVSRVLTEKNPVLSSGAVLLYVGMLLTVSLYFYDAIML